MPFLVLLQNLIKMKNKHEIFNLLMPNLIKIHEFINLTLCFNITRLNKVFSCFVIALKLY